MLLQTDRLVIFSLTLEQHKLLLSSMEEMEHALKLNASGDKIDEHTHQAMEWLYTHGLEHPEKYWWYTNWQIILKETNTSIGSTSFMGEPDKAGNIAFGYGINKKYQNSGYMTEAATAIIQWALNQPDVFSISAETIKANTPSQKVLKNVGMKLCKKSDTSYFYKIVKDM